MKTLRNSLDANIFFLNALESYIIVNHIHWIDLKKTCVFKVCTLQLYYLGKYKYLIGTQFWQIAQPARLGNTRQGWQIQCVPSPNIHCVISGQLNHYWSKNHM